MPGAISPSAPNAFASTRSTAGAGAEVSAAWNPSSVSLRGWVSGDGEGVRRCGLWVGGMRDDGCIGGDVTDLFVPT